MPLVTQKFIRRADLQANPTHFYVFGDNLARRGNGGQAREMRGEPNAIGVATKRYPNNTDASYFEGTADYDRYGGEVYTDLERVEAALLAGCTVVVPEAGIGTGYARLKWKCPAMLEMIENYMERLKHDYGN